MCIIKSVYDRFCGEIWIVFCSKVLVAMAEGEKFYKMETNCSTYNFRPNKWKALMSQVSFFLFFFLNEGAYHYWDCLKMSSQMIAVSVGNLIMLQFGVSMGMSTVINGQLIYDKSRTNEDFTLSHTEASWYGKWRKNFDVIKGAQTNFWIFM